MFQSNDQMQHITKSNVRGGSGSPGFCYLFTEAQLGGRAEMMAEITLQPGESVGVHPHTENAEVYYLLEGSAMVSEDGTEHELQPGDAEFCADGHTHSIRNHTDAPIRFFAVVLPNRG